MAARSTNTPFPVCLVSLFSNLKGLLSRHTPWILPSGHNLYLSTLDPRQEWDFSWHSPGPGFCFFYKWHWDKILSVPVRIKSLFLTHWSAFGNMHSALIKLRTLQTVNVLPLLWRISLNNNGTSPDFLPRMESTTDIEIESPQFIFELIVYSKQLREVHLMMYINAFTNTEGIKSINTCFIQAEPDLNTQL